MARLIVLCLIFLVAFVVVAKANEIAEPPQIRRLGNRQHRMGRSSAAPSLSPSEVATLPEENMVYSEESETIQLQHINIEKEHRHHHSFDKSVAGGGVILGGLATTFLVAIFCYIRATRRKRAEPTQSHPTAAEA